MPSINISVPDTMRAYVEEQTTVGGYSTVSEYVRALIRADQKAKAQDRLEQLVLDGLASGEATAMTPDDWSALRGELTKRIEARRTRGA